MSLYRAKFPSRSNLATSRSQSGFAQSWRPVFTHTNPRRANKVKVISHRAYGFSTSWAYIANIYHCCAGLPLPWEIENTELPPTSATAFRGL